MKSIIYKIIGIILLCLFACNTVETPPVIEESKGRLAFYTNVHDLLSCDSVKVSVYIDSEYVGTINKSCLGDSSFRLTTSDSVLVIEKPVGSYSYIAKTEPCDSIIWEGTVDVMKDTITQVPLNVVDVVDELRKIKFKLIGNWKDYVSEGDWYVLFTKKDTVREYLKDGRQISYGSYKVISKDSIEFDRPTNDPKRHPRITRNKITLTGNDTLMIKHFTRVTTSVFGLNSRYLIKIK